MNRRGVGEEERPMATRARGPALCLALAAALAALEAAPAWACAVPTMEVLSGVVRGVGQEAGVDPSSPWGPDIPGATLELQGPKGPLRFRLSRNIGMTLRELRARARDGRPVQVKYENTYDGWLRALEIVGAEPGS